MTPTTSPGPIDRVLEAIVPRAVDAIDVERVIEQVDIDALIQRVDIDALIQRVDIDALILRVDVDALIQRLDIDALVKRAHIDTIVSNASRGVFARLIDAVRRQLVGLDALLIGGVARLFRRPREAAVMATGTVTGRTAGGVSRLAAFLIDVVVISVSYGLMVALISYLVGLFTGRTVDLSNESWWALGSYVTFGFFYFWIGLSVTGRSVGKGLIGLRVVEVNGDPISPGRAAVRTIVYPLSFILGLGLIPIVTGKQRRALHDFAAGDKELYDWGDRPAELPAPLSAWVHRHSEPAEPAGQGAAATVTNVPDQAGDAGRASDPSNAAAG